MKLMKFNIYVLFCFVLYSCSADRISYLDYVNDPDHGLVSVQATDNCIYSLQYRTAEFMVLIETGDETVNSREFDAILEEYDDLEYYLLTIKNREPRNTNSNLSQQLNFEFKNEIALSTQMDDINPSLYHFEGGLETFGEYRCLLGFQKLADFDRLITIRAFDVDSIIQFNISQESISKIPELSI